MQQSKIKYDGCQTLNLPPDYKYERNFGSSRDVAHIREGLSFQKLFSFADQCENPIATKHVNELLGSKDRDLRAQTKIPLKRMANSSEIAKPVVFLASECASFITGMTLTTDGRGNKISFLNKTMETLY